MKFLNKLIKMSTMNYNILGNIFHLKSYMIDTLFFIIEMKTTMTLHYLYNIIKQGMLI